jgi:hypothetical protein
MRGDRTGGATGPRAASGPPAARPATGLGHPTAGSPLCQVATA